MEEKLPEELPGHAAAIPHPEHVERVESWTDRLLQALSCHREQPATARHWLKPTEELPAHVLQVVFAPTPGAASVELLVGGEDERPVIRVDGNFCAWPEGEDDDFESKTFEQAVLDESVAVLDALLGDVPREPLRAWRIADADGRWREFYARKLSF